MKLIIGQYDQFGDLITQEYLDQFNANLNQSQYQSQPQHQSQSQDDDAEDNAEEQQPAALRIIKINGLKIEKGVMIWVNLESPRFNDSGSGGVMLSSNGHVLLSGVLTENLRVWVG
ncbi:unnamed protein product [Ambrosiozyma monospora]|uniref:Unnamed protein product n=1 Tax=Ambrosiozyma monospora TaxID=43982 RepID=A0ACB5SWU9_AMBMO|nr:unnamed protein product [Ambrosiozyma monospora]